MIGFSGIQEVLKKGTINTQAFGVEYSFFYAIGKVEHPVEPEAWELVATAKDNDYTWGFHIHLVPLRDSDGKIKAAQIVNEAYGDDGIRKKGIPEALILKFVEDLLIPVFSSIPGQIASEYKIYNSEHRVEEATKVWSRLEKLTSSYSNLKVNYYPNVELYLVIPNDIQPDQLLLAKKDYYLPDVQNMEDDRELGEDEKERDLPF